MIQLDINIKKDGKKVGKLEINLSDKEFQYLSDILKNLIEIAE